jgi:hypothetical protein
MLPIMIQIHYIPREFSQTLHRLQRRQIPGWNDLLIILILTFHLKNCPNCNYENVTEQA